MAATIAIGRYGCRISGSDGSKNSPTAIPSSRPISGSIGSPSSSDLGSSHLLRVPDHHAGIGTEGQLIHAAHRERHSPVTRQVVPPGARVGLGEGGGHRAGVTD